jgi:hypothetical protein
MTSRVCNAVVLPLLYNVHLAGDTVYPLDSLVSVNVAVVALLDTAILTDGALMLSVVT